jgi:DNA recombination protein RmuC
MGTQMATLRNTYDEAHKKLYSGRGNLISKVEQLKKMGARASKVIPEKYVDDNTLLNEAEE